VDREGEEEGEEERCGGVAVCGGGRCEVAAEVSEEEAGVCRTEEAREVLNEEFDPAGCA